MILQINHTQPYQAVHKLTAFLMQMCVHKMNVLTDFRWQDLYYRECYAKFIPHTKVQIHLTVQHSQCTKWMTTLTNRPTGLKINGLLDLKGKKVLVHLSRTERENNHTHRIQDSWAWIGLPAVRGLTAIWQVCVYACVLCVSLILRNITVLI